jgi:hypothetical protein
MPRPLKCANQTAIPNHPLCPYIPQHSASFDFRPFEDLGKPFVTAVVSVFAKRAGGYGKSAAKQDYHSLEVLFRWIQSCMETFPGFRQKLRANYKAISVDEWESVLHTWRDEFVNGKNEKSESTRAQIIRDVNVFIDAWVCAKILKPISRLAPIRYANKKARPKKCLAEVSNNSVKHRSIEESGLDQETQSSRFSTEDIAQNGRRDTAAALAKINKQRLGDLRRCAEEELKVWYNHFMEGERLLRLCDMPFSKIRKVIHSKYCTLETRRRAIAKLFPKRSPDLTLSRYLTYVLHEYSGLIPINASRKPYTFHSDFCRSRGLRVANLRAHLTPHVRATNAVKIIFMVDTGANVSVCHSLERNCLSESDLPKHKSIAGFKDRARGKLIVSELPINDPEHEISCVQAVEWYEHMSQRLRDRAPRTVKTRLLLHHSLPLGVVPITCYESNRQFKLFLARHQEFDGLDLTADMIRPTVLFQTIYQNEGNLIAANALADHSAFSTTSLYSNKPALRLIYEGLIREFQSLFQTVSISNIEGAAQKLNMAAPQFSKHLRRARRTGLGVACLNPKAGYQPDTLKGKNCTSLENCPRCPLRFVVASVSNITDLILFYRHLRMSRPEFEATRPQRWLETWLPWLVFADLALEKIQRGPTAAVFLSAKAAADARILAGSVNFPPLS